MRSRNSFASSLMPCLLAVGFLGTAPVINDASAAKLKTRESGRNYVLEMRRRNRGPRIPLPIGPSYLYYDYPYYYSRGHYPTHIGGYVYYPYDYSRSYYRGPASPRRQRARGHWSR
jgi:hypothetical protein